MATARLRAVGKDEVVKRPPPQPLVAAYIDTLRLSDGSEALLMVSREGVVYSLDPNGGWLALNMMEVFDNGEA